MISNQKHGLEDRGKIILYPKRSRLLFMTSGAFLFVFAGFYIRSTANEGRIPPFLAVIVSYLAIGFFGLCFIYGLYRLVVRRPSLILSRDGILDNASAVNAGLVRWEEINRIFCSSMQRQQFVSITLKDAEGFLGRMGVIKARLMRVNVRLVGAPINLPANVLAMTSSELLELIQGFRDDQHL